MVNGTPKPKKFPARNIEDKVQAYLDLIDRKKDTRISQNQQKCPMEHEIQIIQIILKSETHPYL